MPYMIKNVWHCFYAKGAIVPGYKTHIVGGCITYGVALYALSTVIHPTPLTHLEWLLCTLLGSLFPDIDVKSKGQNVAYLIIFVVLAALLLQGRNESAAILGVVALIPMVVRHRGIFHQMWFIIMLGAVLVMLLSYCLQLPCRKVMFDVFFFVLGALSHLILDKGVFKALSIR